MYMLHCITVTNKNQCIHRGKLRITALKRLIVYSCQKLNNGLIAYKMLRIVASCMWAEETSKSDKNF